MLTMLSPPGVARRTWSLLAAILVGLFATAAFVAPPPLDLELSYATEAPPLIAPIAILALAGVVGYAFSDRLTRTKTSTLLTIATLAFLALVFHAGAGALAQEASDAANGVVTPTESTVITIDTVTLSFLVGSVMPLLTALATKLTATPTVKGMVNLLLSVAGGVLAAFVTNSGSLTYQEIAAAAIATYLSAQAVYSGVLRPALAPKVAAIAPNSGVG